MKTIDFAEKAKKEAQTQYELGSDTAHDDILYWRAYLDGTKAMRHEIMRNVPCTSHDIIHAIGMIEIMAIKIAGRLGSLEETDPEAAVLSDNLNALDLSLKLLRQMQEVNNA